MAKSLCASLRTAVLGFVFVACARTETPLKEPAAPTPLSFPAVSADQSPGSGPSTEPSAPPDPTATEAEPAADAQATDTAAPTERRTPDVIYVPTPEPVVDKMLALAKPKKTDVLYDLGCGDGRIVVTAAKKYGIRAVGFDIDPERVYEARENVRKNGVEDLVSIEEKDIFTLDLSPADIVTLYLLPDLNVKLIPQLEKLKPGSRVVTHDFDIEGIKPVTTFRFPAGSASPSNHRVYLFNIPFKKLP